MSIEITRATDLPDRPGDRVIRYSLTRSLIAAALLVHIGGALVWFLARREGPLAWYIGALLLVILAFVAADIRARRRPSSWLLRVANDGLYVHLRSYRNAHLMDSPDPVAFIPWDDIASARVVKERRDIPSASAGAEHATHYVQRRTLIVLEVNADTHALVQALDAERRARVPLKRRLIGRSRTTWLDYPVRLADDNTLEIEWNVGGSADSFVESLRDRIRVGPLVSRTRDFADLEKLGREQQVAALRELAEAGNIIAAVAMARRLYGYDLAEAREFVDRLAAERRERP